MDRYVGGFAGVLQRLLGVELVQALGQALGAAAVVDEDDRAGVLLDQLQQLRVDRGPDRAVVGLAGELRVDAVGAGWRACRAGAVGGADRGGRGRARIGHVLDRHDDLEVELLADARVDDLALLVRPTQELGDPLERPLRRRKADALDRLPRQRDTSGEILRFALRLPGFRQFELLLEQGVHLRVLHVVVEALQRQRHVGAALGRGDGVDLVHDHGLHPGQDLPRLRGHHQIERLGRRDQDVGRPPQHRRAVLLRRVAGAQADGDLGPDPGQRRPQVALDVVGERLQRRDVDDLHPGAELLGTARERVDSPEEGGERLAGAGRRADQRVGAGRDLRPAHCLSRVLRPRTSARTSHASAC